MWSAVYVGPLIQHMPGNGVELIIILYSKHELRSRSFDLKEENSNV